MKFVLVIVALLTFLACNPLVQAPSTSSNFNPGYDNSNSCSAIQVDQNNSLLGFGGGNSAGVIWDSTHNYLRLNQTGAPTNNSELDSSWTPAWSNIVEYLKLNEGAGLTTVNDSSSVGTNSGGVTGGVTLGMAGKLNTAATFNGTGCINSGNANSVQLSSGTISAWINTTASVVGYQTIVAKQDAFGLFLLNNVLVNYDWSTSLTNTTGINISDGNWHHVAMSFQSGVVNGTQIFLDGVSVLTMTYTISNQTTFLGIGCNNAVGQDITGTLDDAAVWNTPLTASQILTIYNRQLSKYAGTFQSRVMSGLTKADTWTSLGWTPTLPFFKELPDGGSSETQTNYPSLSSGLMSGIVGLWHLDETGGATAYDNSGNSVSGTYPVGYTLGQPGKLGNAPLLNGTNGYVLTGNLKGLFTTTDLTLSIWFKANAAGVIASELGQTTINTSWHDSQIEILSTGQVSISVWKGSTFNLILGTVRFGQWSHVVLRYNSTTTYLDGFLNGVKIPGAVGTRQYPNGSFASNYYYALGATDITNQGSGAYFDGLVDEFAIWSRPIADNEAVEIYRRGANRLMYQIRTCSDSACSTNSTWLGPDGTNQTYFSEMNNNLIQSAGGDISSSDLVQLGLPSMTFTNFSSVPKPMNHYFQYRTILESDDTGMTCNYGGAPTWCSPELQNVNMTQTCN